VIRVSPLLYCQATFRVLVAVEILDLYRVCSMAIETIGLYHVIDLDVQLHLWELEPGHGYDRDV
jgi:hypothetical protein